jgi:hypothetical protein
MRGERVIEGTLEMIVMVVLQHQPMHGWGITELIERRRDGLLSMNQRSLYPALYRLLARGWVVRVAYHGEQPLGSLLIRSAAPRQLPAGPSRGADRPPHCLAC